MGWGGHGDGDGDEDSGDDDVDDDITGLMGLSRKPRCVPGMTHSPAAASVLEGGSELECRMSAVITCRGERRKQDWAKGVTEQ